MEIDIGSGFLSSVSELKGARKSLALAMLSCAPIFLNSCDGAVALSVGNETQVQKYVVPLEIYGFAMQSGTIVGKTVPFSKIDAGGINTSADKDGDFVFGFDRDAPKTVTLVVTTPNGHSVSKIFNPEKRDYKVSEVNGLPPATINPPPEAMAIIERDSALKQKAFISLSEDPKGFLQPFIWPLKSIRVTSPWGAQRSLNGNLQRPHYGIDLGAPLGTNVYAPATGRVVLAQSGMHYEGGMISIDHGQGLITNYLHLSKIVVRPGDVLQQGQKIGEVGKEGRANGPHLCWRMRWKGRQLDPSMMVKNVFENKISAD